MIMRRPNSCAATRRSYRFKIREEPRRQPGRLNNKLRDARPDVGSRWTDDGSGRDRRGLKHRAEGETRRVPCPPPLTNLLRDHLSIVAGEPADLLFQGVQG